MSYEVEFVPGSRYLCVVHLLDGRGTSDQGEEGRFEGVPDMGGLQRFMSFLGFSEQYEEENGAEPDGDGEPSRGRRAQVLSLHAAKQQEIVVLQPRTFEDARAAADYLKLRRPVVVNLQGSRDDLARRIVDFTSGVTYALDGHMLRVGEEIFLFTPSHIVITADMGSEDDQRLFPLE